MTEIEKYEPAEVAEIPWTRFHDMHSGGGRKEDYDVIYIQAPEDDAAIVFYHRFGHRPDDIACGCCGENYSYYEIDTDPVTDVQEDMRFGVKDVLVIPADNIHPFERS